MTDAARRSLRPALLLCACLLALGGAGASRAQDAPGLAVKAAYLYKLAPFVDWPAGSFAASDSPFDLCVVGDDPFGPVLDRVVAGQSVGGHPVVVHRLTAPDPSVGCELAFVAGSSALPIKDALAQLAGKPVLTVTDNAADSPGIVDFVSDEDRVRFRINDQAAADNGLTISSKLESLAVSVLPRKTGSAP